MKGFHWSRLYPRPWRAQFGEEFDAMLEMSRPGPKDWVDIVGHAFVARVALIAPKLPALCGWIAICWLNMVAKEVQWPAGMLLLCSAVATASSPKGWLKHPAIFAAAIPLSSLYFYQIPGIHHEPLYKTAVAFVPAFLGSVIGLVAGIGMRDISQKA